MYMTMFMFLMHDIVVQSSCVLMSLYEVFLLYMHYVGLIDYMMKVLLGLYEESILFMLMQEVNVKTCGLMIGLLSMCEVMGFHMYIKLVDLYWDCE